MEIIAPLGEVSKNYCILHRKWVDFMTCKIYFNRVAFKKPIVRSKLIVRKRSWLPPPPHYISRRASE